MKDIDVVNTVCPAVAVNAWRRIRLGSNEVESTSDSIHICPTEHMLIQQMSIKLVLH
jgi:hypothetical protein